MTTEASTRPTAAAPSTAPDGSNVPDKTEIPATPSRARWGADFEPDRLALLELRFLNLELGQCPKTP